MKEFIYECPHSLSDASCNDIIQMFETDDNRQYTGVTAGGVNEKVKKSTDLCIPNNVDETSKWYNIINYLSETLSIHLNEYLKSLQSCDAYKSINNTSDYKIMGANFLTEDCFMIMRYTKGEGKYEYHNDFSINYEMKKYRVIAFLWYLNSVDEGGETEFWGNYTIKPETGKLVLFPASWTFPHKGKIPISNDKYIVTGWLYLHDK